MLGDIILAEPGALIGFAGPRVIEQTIRQKLPKGFQSSKNVQQEKIIFPGCSITLQSFMETDFLAMIRLWLAVLHTLQESL